MYIHATDPILNNYMSIIVPQFLVKFQLDHLKIFSAEVKEVQKNAYIMPK